MDVLLGLLDGLFLQQVLQQLELEAAAPQVVGLSGGGGPGGLGAVEGEGVVGREIDVLVQLGEDPVHPRLGPLFVQDVDVECRVQQPEGAQVVIEPVGVAPCERLFVRGEKKQPLAVEIGHVVADQVAAEFRFGPAVNGFVIKMDLLEQLDRRGDLRCERARSLEIALRQGSARGEDGEKNDGHRRGAAEPGSEGQGGHHHLGEKGRRTKGCIKRRSKRPA